MLKKEWSCKRSLILFLLLSCAVFAWCNLLPPVAGMGGADYYQLASGGFLLKNPNGCQTFFEAIPFENTYRGTMNGILKPLSLSFSGVDVRLLSVVYFFAVLGAFVFFLKRLQPEKEWYRLLVAGVAWFLFCDFAYLLHLNSFNPEGAFYCVILVMVSLALAQFHHKATILKCIVYMALAFFAAGLKNNYFWLGILLAAGMFPTFYLRKDNLYRVLTGLLFLAVCSGSIFCFGGGISYSDTQKDLFHSVYYGILKDNTDTQAFSELGIPEEAAQYVGKTVYDVEEAILDDVRFHSDYGKVVSYYVKHPLKFLKKMEISADNGYEIRQQYISNYPDDFRLKYGFNLYSALKRRFLQPDFWFVIAVLGAVITFCVWHFKKERQASKKAHYLFVILLSVITFLCFAAPVIISGEAGLAANLFLYNLFFDIILAHIIVGATITLVKRREQIQQKYGVRQ